MLTGIRLLLTIFVGCVMMEKPIWFPGGGIVSRAKALLLTILCAVCTTVVLAQASGYRITRTYNLGGDGRWDYVVPDPPHHRLFIGRTNRVMVVDEDSGKLLGEVTGIDGAHGTALAERWGHGFATSGNDGTVVMFDLKTLKSLGKTPAALDADAIIYDPASDRIFSLNGDAHSSTVINPMDGKLVTNIPLGGKPEYAATANDGKVYANITDNSEVVEIDARSLSVSRRWPTEPCRQPVSMAIDTKNHRLFSGCRSGVLAVSDYVAGRIVAMATIGTGVDGTGFDATTGNVFASNADGTLTIIHQDTPDKYHVVENIQTAQGSRNLGLDSTNHRLFLPAADFGPVPANSRQAPIVAGTFRLLVVERSSSK